MLEPDVATQQGGADKEGANVGGRLVPGVMHSMLLICCILVIACSLCGAMYCNLIMSAVMVAKGPCLVWSVLIFDCKHTRAVVSEVWHHKCQYR